MIESVPHPDVRVIDPDDAPVAMMIPALMSDEDHMMGFYTSPSDEDTEIPIENQEIAIVGADTDGETEIEPGGELSIDEVASVVDHEYTHHLLYEMVGYDTTASYDDLGKDLVFQPGFKERHEL